MSEFTDPFEQLAASAEYSEVALLEQLVASYATLDAMVHSDGSVHDPEEIIDVTVKDTAGQTKSIKLDHRLAGGIESYSVTVQERDTVVLYTYAKDVSSGSALPVTHWRINQTVNAPSEDKNLPASQKLTTVEALILINDMVEHTQQVVETGQGKAAVRHG